MPLCKPSVWSMIIPWIVFCIKKRGSSLQMFQMTNTPNRIIRTFAAALVLAFVVPACVSRKKSSDPSSPSSAFEKAASKFHANIGDGEWEKFQTRLASVDQDIASHGILTVSNYPLPLETGYAYHQFYDWDLYFEN